MSDRIVVLHTEPDELRAVLQDRCRDAAALEFVDRPDDVAAALASTRPDTVLSIKHSLFPGPAHRPALHWPDTRWFHVGGSGTEHLGMWTPAVTVTNSAGVLAPFLAEMAMAAMLSLSTGLHRYHRLQQAQQWAPGRFRPLAGRTLLIVGLGHVGRALAMRASALGMTVIGTRRSGAPVPGVAEVHPPEALHRLLPRADVLSVHVRLTPETAGMIDREALARLPRGALLLNSARGPIIVENDLIQAIEDGLIGGAWLDVFDHEPLPAGHPLWSLDHVLITPHCADQTEDFAVRFATHFCDLRDRRRRGHALPALRSPSPPAR